MRSPADSINDRGGHIPHGPEFGLGAYTPNDELEQRRINELFQPPHSRNGEEIRLLMLDFARNPNASGLAVDDYQEWCAIDWKEPQGTTRSEKRLSDKLIEEAEELGREIDLREAPTPEQQTRIVDELGDVLWCTTALTNDLGRNIKRALMARMGIYGQGTRAFSDGSIPDWITFAQKLAFEDRDFTLDKIDQLVDEGYVPQPSPIFNLDEDDRMEHADLQDSINYLYINIKLLHSFADRTYGPDNYHTGGSIKDAWFADSLVAEIYLNSAYMAKKLANSSLLGVVKANVLKLSDRVATKHIDKSDGERDT